MERILRPEKIAETARKLHDRIEERFPDSGLGRIADDLCTITEDVRRRTEALARMNVPLRVLGAGLVASIAALLVYFISSLRSDLPETLTDFIGVLEPALGAMVFIGAFFLFVWSLEMRWKRARALAALHELRSLAHVVDMHQLTKDPERAIFVGPDTRSSPRRDLTPFELSRYFDYCSELLALISKVSALYAQSFVDDVALAGVDQVEALCSGLSRNIWQKVILLEHAVDRENETPPAPL